MKFRKKLIAFALAIVMCAASIPNSIYADTETGSTTEETTETTVETEASAEVVTESSATEEATETSTTEEESTSTTTEEESSSSTTEETEEASSGLLGATLAAEQGSTDTLQSLIDAAESGATITLTQNYTEDITIKDGKNITIDLSSYTITASGSSSSCITVYGTLTLKDSSYTEAEDGTITYNGAVVNADDNTERGVIVASKGTFTFEGGTISGFSVSGNGGGILVEKNGTFAMTGGIVSGNSATVYGGGIYIYEADQIADITGGTISGNTAGKSGGGLAATLSTGGSVTLQSGLTISGNTATSSYGGGFYYYNSLDSLTISSTISNNTSGSCGGGVYLGASITTLNITDATIDGNTAGDAGGGCYFAVAVPTATISGSSISGNTAAGNGGGLWFTSGTDLTLKDSSKNTSKINNNKIEASGALYGGGIYLYSVTGARSTFTATGGEISGNKVTSADSTTSYGGGIYIHQYATVTMSGTTVSSNSGATTGGGISIGSYVQSLTLTNLTVSGNKAVSSSTSNSGNGGGIYVGSYSVGTVTISGGEWSGNSAEYYGGAVFMATNTSTLALTDGVKIDGNSSYTTGGGIYAEGYLVLTGGESEEEAIEICNNTSQVGTGAGAYAGAAGSSTSYAITATGYVKVHDNSTENNGGGLAVGNGGMDLSGNIYVYNNYAKGSNYGGGGLYASGYSTSVYPIYLHDGVYVYNNTCMLHGGGVYSRWELIIGDGVEIYGNYAGSYGGGVAALKLNMTEGKIYNNSAAHGGGIWNVHGTNSDSNVDSYISGGKIYGNTATTGSGGGIYVSSYPNKLYISDSVEIYDNTAYSYGGGIYTADWISITGGKIYGNSAQRGGGVFVYGYKGQTATIQIADGSSGIIYDNTATSVNYGNDLALNTYQSSGASGYNESAYSYAVMTVGAASTFSDSDSGITGTYWYDEVAVSYTENAINTNNEDLSTTTGHYYTFVYNKDSGEVAEVWNTLLNFGSGGYQIFSSVQEAVDAVAAADSGTYGTKNSADGTITIIMLSDSREDVTITSGLTVTLDLAGCTLKGLVGSVITVPSGATLTIEDSSEEGTGLITGGNGSLDTEVNFASTYIFGGGLYIKGTVTLYSGTISGNTAKYGAGVYVATNGTFTMAGGTIEGNTSTSDGGGVYVYNKESATSDSDFVMTGGSIKENKASYGAALYFVRANIKITNGEITGNTATVSGGAIYSTTACTMTITGGSITENTAQTGGGIYSSNTSSSLTVSENGTALYGNVATTGVGNDIYMSVTSGKISLLAASDMGNTSYNSWYDSKGAGTTTLPYYYTSSISYGGTSNHIFDLTAVYHEDGYVAYIPSDSGTDMVYQIATTDSETGATTYTYTMKDPETVSNGTVKSATGTAYPTLQSAIYAATDDDVIYLLCDCYESVYIEGATARGEFTIDLNGYTLYSTGDYGIYMVWVGGSTLATTNLTIQSTSSNTFKNTESDATGTITKAETNSSSFARGIYMYTGGNASNESYLTIDSVVITGFGDSSQAKNTGSSTYNGGAIYTSSYNSVTLKGSTKVTDNYAYYGGGIYMGGLNIYLTIDDGVEINGNTAYRGGGLYFSVSGSTSTAYTETLDIKKATISNNTAYAGGGMYVNGWNSGSNTGDGSWPKVTMTGTTVSGNTATSEEAGAYMSYVANVTIDSCTFKENVSSGSYGALYINPGSTVAANGIYTIKDSEFTDNKAANSYAGLVVAYGKTNIEGCSFTGNTAATTASALYLNSVINGSTLTGCTFEENTSSTSGYIVYVANSVLAVSETDIINNTTVTNAGTICVYNGSATVQTVVTFDKCEISDNTGYGLDMYLQQVSGVVATLTKTTISGNYYGVCLHVSSSYNNYRDRFVLNVCDGTEIANNIYNGIYSSNAYCTINIKGGKIYGNTGASYGGGVYAAYANFNMSGGEIYDNTAPRGGGVYLSEASYTYAGGTYNNVYYDQVPADTITGGKIYNNTSTSTSDSGAGIYVGNYNKLVMTGGTIIENTAAGFGGGVYVHQVLASFELGSETDEGTITSVGQVYNNTALLGQDVYATYHTDYLNTALTLVKASDMFDDDSGMTGIGWLNESTEVVTTTSINYNPVKKLYPLTLEYETDSVVAVIWNTSLNDGSGGYEKFTSVQAAVDALQEDKVDSTGNYYTSSVTSPEIILVDDAVGNVEIPGTVTATINLNGYTLKGSTTAITCSGTLTIKDVQYTTDDDSQSSSEYYCEHYSALVTINQSLHLDDETGETTKSGAGKDEADGTTYTGTITGTAASNGGGIYINSGGDVTMESGQIANCAAGGSNTGSSYGGAGVYIAGGTFTLTGTASINNCTTKAYGSAVYVAMAAGRFNMLGGTIEGNSSGGGTVYVANGTFKLADGEITDNSATNGAGIYVGSSGKLTATGGYVTENTATTSGGGIYLVGGTATLSGVEISDNTVTAALTTTVTTGAGGGIYMASGTLTIKTGTKITGNTAARGGGIFQSGGTATMTGGQITKNTAEYGGGVAQNPSSTGTFTLSGGVIAANASNSGAGNDIYSTTDSGEKGSSTVTLIRAAAMKEDGYTKTYNAWKDDTYTGDDRSGTTIGSGQYVTGIITSYSGMQLTADNYGDDEEEEEEVTSSLSVKNITMDSKGIVDGETTLDDSSIYTVGYETSDDTNSTWSATSNVNKNPLANSWTAGYDSSASNGLVRSFDTVSYYCLANTEVSGDTSNNKITLCVQIELELTSDKAQFASLDFDSYEVSESDDGSTQYLTGYKTVEEKTGATSFAFAVQVRGMKNGELVTPKITSWIEENETNVKNPASLTPTSITVSATGRYNITLLKNSQLTYTGYFDLETGEETTKTAYEEAVTSGNSNIIYGTMIGYGVTLSLWNTTSNGMTGIEIPEGDITFNLSFKSTLNLYSSSDEVGSATPSESEAVAPYVWAYKANENTETGTSFPGYVKSANMDWSDEDDTSTYTRYAYDAAPFNSRGVSSTLERNTCYSGGAWTASGSNPSTGNETETTVTFTVSNYTIDSALETLSPYRMSNDANYSVFDNSYTRAFSAGYVQVIVPVTDDFASANGYVAIDTQAIASDMELSKQPVGGIEEEDTSSNSLAATETEALAILSGWYSGSSGNTAEAKNEIKYADNYASATVGLYISSGDGETLDKQNYFRNAANSANIPTTRSNGDGSTLLGSEVYVASEVTYGCGAIDATTMVDDGEEIENALEYNYLTAFDLLQKFDADAYTPVGTSEPIINQTYSSRGKYITDENTFYISTSETATDWSGNTTKTYTYTLTILYAAKPDGSNWEYSDVDIKGTTYKSKTTEMDSYTEDDLIYFTTLEDLHTYFSDREDGGNCVAILYEFRNCCIRTGRYVDVMAKMQVTNEYEAVGNTYAITNDVIGWSTYRPTYKKYLAGTLSDEIFYSFSWYSDEDDADVIYKTQNDVTAYGMGAGTTYPTSYQNAATAYDNVDGYSYSGLAKLECYNSGYVKTEYSGGYMLSGSHAYGYKYGNTLLIYALESDINIVVSDKENASSGASKKNYNLSNGEYVANFTVSPDISLDTSVSNDVVSSGKLTVDVIITITLPDNLYYNDGTLTFDYSGSGYEDGELSWDITYDETTNTITLTTQVTDVDKNLPEINYSATIGIPGTTTSEYYEKYIVSKSLTTTAAIYLAYESEEEKISTDTKTASVSITPTGTAQEYIWVEGAGKLDLGSDLEFTLNYENSAGLSDTVIEIGTILPYNGDYSGTSFDGAYQLETITLTFTDEDSYKAYLGDDWDTYQTTAGKLLYADSQAYDVEYDTTSSTNKVTNLATIMSNTSSGTAFTGTPTVGTVKNESGETVGWTITYTLTADEKAALTQYASEASGIGLYVYLPSVAQNKAVSIDITMATSTESSGYVSLLTDSDNTSVQESGNIYYETMFYREYTDEETKKETSISNNAYIIIVERTLSGIVWLDQDGDGQYTTTSTSTDKPLKDVDVYLYTTNEPAANGVVTRDTDTEGATYWKQTITDSEGKETTLTLYGTTIAGVYDTNGTDLLKLYPATDVLGNLVEPTVSSETGLYTFYNLPAGTYYVVFKDDINETTGKAEYTVENTGETPISFSLLSVTDQSNLTSNGAYNKSKASYDETNANTGETLLASAYISNEITDTGGTAVTSTGIDLPATEEITGTVFASSNWNNGLNYVTLTIEKIWENLFDLSDISDGDSVSFEILGTVDDGSGDTETVSDTVYTMKKTGESTLTGTGVVKNVNDGSTVSVDSFDIVSSSEADEDTATMTVTWSYTVALQAKSNDKEITYTYYGSDGASATAKDGISESSTNSTTGISGFKLSSASYVEGTDEDGAITYTYSATNTQIAYALDLEKISSTSTSGSPYYLAGATFTLFDDGNCKDEDIVATYTSSGNDTTSGLTGEIFLGYLEPGTYYLKETTAPDGYLLNAGVWEITIEFDTSNETSSFTVKLINDEKTGEALTGDAVVIYTNKTSDGGLTTGTAATDYIVTGYNSDGEVETDGSKIVLYTITFEVSNEISYELPESGGAGTLPFFLVGTALILTSAILLYRRRRRITSTAGVR